MSKTQEQLLEDLKAAKSKVEMLKAAAALAHGQDAAQVADPELMADIRLKLMTHENANFAPTFDIPFSVKLLTLMAQDLGPGWYVLVSAGAYAAVVGDPQTTTCMDPVVKYSDLLAGHLGVLYGTNVYTDSYYHPELQILPRGVLYVMSADGKRGHAARVV